MTNNDSSSRSQRLFFTSSESEELLPSFAPTGLYSCTLQDYGGKYSPNDDDYEDDGGFCIDPKTVANTYNLYADAPSTMDLPLMNVQFYVSSKNNGNSKSNGDRDRLDASDNDNGNNYVYASTMVEHKEYSKHRTWEILRADLPTSATNIENNNHDNGLDFKPYFRTLEETDWNNCNFDCCPFNDDVDSNGIQAHRDYHDDAFTHAYVRVTPRTFSIDHQTGDIFIVWEGFYKNCNPVAVFYAAKKMEWTIGISRLKTEAEDSTCIFAKKENGESRGWSDLEMNFSRCTKPVAIVFKGTRGREVTLPHGGFSVIPAAQESQQKQENQQQPRRSFLLTAFHEENGEHRSRVWAIPEGGDVTRNLYKRQDVTSTAVPSFLTRRDVWNGGNQRLHYNQETSRPDHLCHTIFNHGIECMSITVTEDTDSVYFNIIGDPEIFLTQAQAKYFCAPGIPLITGLDVLWNEDDGIPERIFFGCEGGQSAGNLGSIDGDEKNLRQMMKGANSGDVVLLPRELDSTTMAPIVNNDHEATPTSSSATQTHLSSNTKTIAPQYYYGIATMILFVVSIASYTFYKKRHPSLSTRSYQMTSNNNNFEQRRALSNTYMELPMIGSSDTSSLSIELT